MIEDDKQLNDFLTTDLAEARMKVESASDPEKATELAKIKVVDTVLFDLMLPKMDGKELMHHIILRKWLGDEVPVIVMTSLADAAIPQGVRGVVSKVVNVESEEFSR